MKNIIQCDVLIVGAGIAGSLAAHELAKNKDNNVIVIDKNYPGSHEASYSIPYEIIRDLDLDHLIINHITKNTYETDTIEYFSSSNLQDNNQDSGLVTVDYAKLCSELLDNVTFIKDEFLDFHDLSFRTILTKSGNIYKPKIVLDATGWESAIRKKLKLPIPKIGAKAVLFKMENCNIEDIDTMRLCVGDFASYGFWIEPHSNSTALIGSGFWDNIQETNPMDNIYCENLLFLYINKYMELFQDAVITEKHFARISVDPVQQIVKQNIVSVGEACGASNPYWTLGAGLIYDFTLQIIPILQSAIDRDNDKEIFETLSQIQLLWESRLKSYQKNWGAARVIWNGYAEGWKDIFERRERLDKYTTPEQLIERQRRGSYSTSYATKMLGIRRIFSIAKYMLIFKLRMTFPKYYSHYSFKFRDPTTYKLTQIRELTASTRRIFTENKLIHENKHKTKLIEVEITVKDIS